MSIPIEPVWKGAPIAAASAWQASPPVGAWQASPVMPGWTTVPPTASVGQWQATKRPPQYQQIEPITWTLPMSNRFSVLEGQGNY